MILTCPSCATRYQTESARIAPPGRNVRCAKCGEVWFHSVSGPEVEPEPEAVASIADEPEAAPEDREAIPSDHGFGESAEVAEANAAGEAYRPGRRWGSAAGWLLLILVIGGFAAGAVRFRQTIATVWPRSASLYAVLGMPVNTRGIAFVNVAYRQEVEDGQPVLSVSGKLVNVTDRELPVPELSVVLTDSAKRELYRWNFDAGVPTLKPGAESPFLTRLSSPPPDVRSLNIRFADAGGAR